MWKARPIVASAVGGIVDQVVSGAHGLLVSNPADLESFGTAVETLLQGTVAVFSNSGGFTTTIAQYPMLAIRSPLRPRARAFPTRSNPDTLVALADPCQLSSACVGRVRDARRRSSGSEIPGITKIVFFISIL